MSKLRLQILLCMIAPLAAAAAEPPQISARSTDRLQKAFAEAQEIDSTTERRRALKNIARDAESLIRRRPEAANRFEALGIVFDCQKQLVVLREDEANVKALIATCNRLMKAPDEYAKQRLEPEILLSQMQLQQSGATEHEQLVAIAELADRYRDTSAEMESLIACAELAFNLGHAELLKAFRYTLSTKFRQRAEAIGFLKERFAFKSSSLLVSGRFRTADGQTLVLPIDRAGHCYLSCFWSADSADAKERMLKIKALQQKYPGRFGVLSFNLDELPDAGTKTLKQWGLDEWTAVHLPGGKNHSLFTSCTTDDEFLIRITNATGYIILTPIGSTYRTFGRVTDLEEYLIITMEEPRFHALIQSLRIGDFLVTDPTSPSEPFVAPPMRYRLSVKNAKERYEKAAKLTDHRAMIGKLGLWNLTGDERHLTEALALSHVAFVGKPTPEANLVARFCQAKAALREPDADADTVLATFEEKAGNSPLAIGAAAVLAMDAALPDRFARYRETLLDKHADDPRLWSLNSYIFDKFVVGRMFRGNHYASEVRFRAGLREWQKDTETRPRRFEMKLNNLGGDDLPFPHANAEYTNVIVLMELPANDESAKVQSELITGLKTTADAHLRQKLNVVVAFMNDDAAAVKAYIGKLGWDAVRTALAPAGIGNPQVLRLGVVMGDERPNTFVVNHDRTIRWGFGGMYHLTTSTGAVVRAVKEFSQDHDLRSGDLALQAGDFDRALKIFGGSYPEDPRKPMALKTAQLEGQSKAYRGLKDWNSAVLGYDSIAKTHTDFAAQHYCECHSLSAKLSMRADVLEALEQKDAAETDRDAARDLACPPAKPRELDPARYESTIHTKLERFKARGQLEEALAYIDDIIVNGKDGRQAQRHAYAKTLKEHAEILDQLGRSEEARNNRTRAAVLEKHGKAGTAESADPGATTRNYVDIVKTK